ncbi:MAG: HNH endonuclease signature motif containing protein [Thermosynechococcaceae cyanobacterium]
MGIPKSLYEAVRQRAQFRCEYCHYPELLSSSPLSVDHIQPQSLGGSDDLENLALACRRCNERRYNFTTGIDLETQIEVPLFNPRQQQWSVHFIWSADALRIMGQTPTGRATCHRLDLNDDRREEPFIQNARRQWLISSLHPANDDPRQLN